MKRLISLLLFFLLFCTSANAYTSYDAPRTDVPNYVQWDERWAEMIYSAHGDKTQTLRKHGCVIVAIANVVAYLCDNTTTPVEIAKIAMWNGYCQHCGGTDTKFCEIINWFYPLQILKTNNIDDVYKCLDEGGVVIAIIHKSLWCSTDGKLHAVTIYAHTEDHFWLHSNVKEEVTGKVTGHGNEKKIVEAAEQFYCYRAKMR